MLNKDYPKHKNQRSSHATGNSPKPYFLFESEPITDSDEISDRSMTFFFYTSLLALCIFAIFGTAYHTAIYGDGGWAFIHVLARKGYHYMDKTRDFTSFFNDIWCLIGIRLGVRSVRILSLLFSLGYALNCITTWVISLIYTYTNKMKSELMWTVMLLSVTLSISGFFMQIESLPALGIFWSLFLYYSNMKNDSREYFWSILFLIMVTISTRQHQCFFFCGALLLAIIVFRLVKKQLNASPLLVYHIIMLMFAVYIGLKSTINPRDKGNFQGALSSISNWNPYLLAFCLLLGLIIASTFFLNNKILIPNWAIYLFAFVGAIIFVTKSPEHYMGKFINVRHSLVPICIVAVGFPINYMLRKLYAGKKQKKQFSVLIYVVQFVTGIFILWLSLKNAEAIASYAYDNRIVTILIVFGICCFVCFLKVFGLQYNTKLLRPICAFLISCTIVISVIARVEFGDYTRTLNEIAKNNMGFVTSEQCGLDRKTHPYLGTWTLPSVSIASQAIYGDGSDISCVIVPPRERVSWEPFNSVDIKSYYNLKDYGVNYDEASFQ